MATPQEILKKAREGKGLTQRALASKLGISERMMQRYEEGTFPKFKPDRIRNIDDILGTNIYDALYGSGAEKSPPAEQDGARQDYTSEYIEVLKAQVKQKSETAELIRRLSVIEATVEALLLQARRQAEVLARLTEALVPGPAQVLHKGKLTGSNPIVEQRVYSGGGSARTKGSAGKKK